MQHTYRRRVHFADTDAAGVAHFSRLLCYAEEAEHEMLEKLGIPLLEGGGWPRVRVVCDYKAPLRAGDTAEVALSLADVGNSAVVWKFAISCKGRMVAEGEMTAVRVDGEGKAVGLPDAWRNALLR